MLTTSDFFVTIVSLAIGFIVALLLALYQQHRYRRMRERYIRVVLALDELQGTHHADSDTIQTETP